MEEFLDQPELALAPDERRLQPRRLPGAAARSDDTQRAGHRDVLRLSAQPAGAGALVGDRGLRRMPRPLADEDGAWIGDRLDTRGRVDEVTGNHALTGRAHGDRRLTGHDRRTGYKARLADL